MNFVATPSDSGSSRPCAANVSPTIESIEPELNVLRKFLRVSSKLESIVLEVLLVHANGAHKVHSSIKLSRPIGDWLPS